jgi:hypothetical protein
MRSDACSVRLDTCIDVIEWCGGVNDGADERCCGDLLGEQRTANLSNRRGSIVGGRVGISGSHCAEFRGVPDVHV